MILLAAALLLPVPIPWRVSKMCIFSCSYTHFGFSRNFFSSLLLCRWDPLLYRPMMAALVYWQVALVLYRHRERDRQWLSNNRQLGGSDKPICALLLAILIVTKLHFNRPGSESRINRDRAAGGEGWSELVSG